jgi:hypothetical protein
LQTVCSIDAGRQNVPVARLVFPGSAIALFAIEATWMRVAAGFERLNAASYEVKETTSEGR